MDSLSEHIVDFSAPQLTKLRKGLNITVQPKHFNPNGKHILNLMGSTHSKIMNAFKKGKGLKISLRGSEHIKKNGEGIGKAFKKVGKAFKDTYASPQAIKTYRQIGKQASKYGLDYALPAVMGGVGEMLGGPAGSMVGSMGADIIADQVHSRTGYGIANRVRARPIGDMQGQGLYKSLAKVGIKKRAVINTAKTIGKNALKLGSETVKAGLQAYGVPPSITDPMINKLERIGERAIDKGTVKGVYQAGRDVKSLGKSTIANIKEEALQYFDDEIDALPMEYRQIANDALDTVQSMRSLTGEGVYNSSSYKKTMRLRRGGAIGIADGYVNLSSLAPSDSPSMHPFVPTNNPYQGYAPIKSGGMMRCGGSFIPAGSGFYPAGYSTR